MHPRSNIAYPYVVAGTKGGFASHDESSLKSLRGQFHVS